MGVVGGVVRKKDGNMEEGGGKGRRVWGCVRWVGEDRDDPIAQICVVIRCRLFFFFSSRRRHTRWPRDWSSDVCSSDLCFDEALDKILIGAERPLILSEQDLNVVAYHEGGHALTEIGRASCRERV